ncbi:MAG: DUF3891 family protein [Nitrospinota bacterium]|nr:MAG: DUF3891 family protein [Nitrospinota bacterium]
MLVQIRADRLRLITQHHHALLSGELAAAWQGFPGQGVRLPLVLILATALHDLAWQPMDRSPLLDPASGRPHSFVTYPLEEKLRHYREGIAAMSRIHPYVGLLGSLHYTTFRGTEGLEAFQARERQRREHLKEQLGLTAREEALLQIHLRYLKLFDYFSLFICLTPPPATKASHPSWLQPSHFAQDPGGHRFHLIWQDENHLVVDPFPFPDVLPLRIPYRDLPDTTYTSAPALQAAWEASVPSYWSVTLIPA